MKMHTALKTSRRQELEVSEGDTATFFEDNKKRKRQISTELIIQGSKQKVMNLVITMDCHFCQLRNMSNH